MRAVLSVAIAKPAAMAAKPSASGKADGAAARENGDDDAGERQRRGRPQRRLAVGGEIDDDAEAEGDRQPGQQPARRDFGERPFAIEPPQAGRGAPASSSGSMKPGAPARGVDFGRPGFGARAAVARLSAMARRPRRTQYAEGHATAAAGCG